MQAVKMPYHRRLPLLHPRQTDAQVQGVEQIEGSPYRYRSCRTHPHDEITGRRTVPQIFIGETMSADMTTWRPGCARRIDAAAGRCIILPMCPSGNGSCAGFVWAAHGARPVETEDFTTIDQRKPRVPDPARLSQGPVARAAQFPAILLEQEQPTWTSSWRGSRPVAEGILRSA